jgi:hypothetical protein
MQWLYEKYKRTIISKTLHRKLKIEDPGQATGKLYHLRVRVECTLFGNLQSWARTHAILVIGLYELLGNPTTTGRHVTLKFTSMFTSCLQMVGGSLRVLRLLPPLKLVAII